MRERRSHQINRAYYARGRPQPRVPQTINEGGNETNFTENEGAGTSGLVNQGQSIQNPLQRRFYSENDVRTTVNFPVNHVAIDMDFDDSANDHINSITAGYGSTWTIADP